MRASFRRGGPRPSASKLTANANHKETSMPSFLRNLAASIVLAGFALSGCTSGSAGSAPTPPPSAPAFPPDTQAKLDSTITSWLAAFKAPGVVVGIWMPEGQYVVAKGYSDAAKRTPMNGDEHFRVGSITKTFTVTALLQLADKKVVTLDDPVSKYLSYVPNGKNITLRMLANMTSGLYNYSFDEGFQKAIFSNPKLTWKPRQLVEISFKHDPVFTPGTGFQYCNTNTVLLGIIIEQVTHQPIARYFRENLFRPLGLTNTVWPDNDSLPRPYAHGISEQTADGNVADVTHNSPTWGFTAGEIISTRDDLRVWVRSYTTGSLISPEMQKQRLTWVTFPPATPKKGYGLGIGIFNGWLGHTGELPGYNAGAFYLPSRDATIVMIVNSDIGHNGKNPIPVLFNELSKIVTPENASGT
jgi:D-alanyl-D-alanine carboxypeptidase